MGSIVRNSSVSAVLFEEPFEDDESNIEFGDIDQDSLALIIALQLEELDAFENTVKGKGREDAEDNSVSALNVYKEQLMAVRQELEDQRVARSFESALSADAALLEEMSREEAVARRDRQIAIALSEGRAPPPDEPEPAPGPSGSSDRNPPSYAAPQFFRGPSSTASSSTVRSVASTSRKPIVALPKVECVICMTAVSSDRAVKVPCGHHYDFDCLIELFLQATKDESLMPARCCKQSIPLDLARPHLTEPQILDYCLKEREHNTPNRLYCPKATCSAFLGAAEKSRGTVTCYKCAARVCPDCKSLYHPFGDCRPNSGDETFLELARQEGYQRCPDCRRFTELSHGCYHMTCPCRAEFCYVCGERWKNCGCPQWDEDRLLDRAQQQVRAEFGRPAPAQVPQYRQRVAQVVNDLRYNHDCAHPRWDYRSGGGRCEECGHYLGVFLLRCRNCKLMACVRCRRNRL